MKHPRSSALLRIMLVWAFTAVLAAASCALWIGPLSSLHPLHSPLSWPWPILALAFAVGNFAAVRVEFHDESHSLNLSDAVLIPAIAFTSAEGVVLASIVGYLVRALWVRQSAIKATFNMALHAFVATVAVLCFHGIIQTSWVLSERGWLAGAAAMVVACVISDGAVQVVIGVSAGRVALAGFRRVGTTFAVTLVAEATLGFVAIHMVASSVLAAILFALSAVAVAVGYAAYGRLQSRHATLGQLYRFDQALAGLEERADVISAVLGETLSLLNAGVAQLIVRTPEGTQCHTLRAGLDQRVTVRVGPHPLAGTSSYGLMKSTLNGRSYPPDLAYDGPAPKSHDVALVEVPSDSEDRELLVVADRLGGDNVTFEEADLTLLDALAAHTSMSLRSCRLLEELRQQVEVKEYQAHHDGLTGLANRVLFYDTLDRAVEERPEGDVVGVLLMDLDGFKTINDTMGHDVGDVLLQQLGARLENVVGERGLFARLGGDEFAVVLPRTPALEDVQALAECLCVAVQEPVEVGGTEVAMRVSVGLTVSPHHGVDRSTLLRRADVAMYQAKRRGGGVAVYDDLWSGAHVGNPTLVSALRGAIGASALEMHYQPKADLRTGKVLGVEALLRWTHPAYGVIGPDQAIPVAERSGLIRPLTLWALETSLSQLAAWRLQDIDIDLAVNLSPILLSDPVISDDIARLLKEHGVAPGALTLELTESLAAGRQLEDEGVAERLAFLGVRLSIDDYGIGASSLARLKNLPVDELKMDKSFVGELVHSTRASTIVASTINLAHELGLTVVGEGVETPETWRHLRELRCDVAQGYLLSRPLPGAAFADWYRGRSAAPGHESALVTMDLPSERL